MTRPTIHGDNRPAKRALESLIVCSSSPDVVIVDPLYKTFTDWTHEVAGIVTTRDDIVPHWTINYVRRLNAEDIQRHGKGAHQRDPYRTARAFNANRHHPCSSWSRWMRTRWT